MRPRPVLLTIAGWDPTGGAGVAADLKVFAAYGCEGAGVVTALTVQTTLGVQRTAGVDAALVRDSLWALDGDLPLAGVKLGMMGTGAVVREVVSWLRSRARRLPAVLDPVLVSSSGHPLLDEQGVEQLRAELLPLVDVVTPNTAELGVLTGQAVPERATDGWVEEASQTLAERWPTLAVVATGGHLGGEGIRDQLARAGASPVWLRGERVATRATHGTGCAFASALLCEQLAAPGATLEDAIRRAKGYITEALRAAVPVGAGGGSMDHLWRWREAQRQEEA